MEVPGISSWTTMSGGMEMILVHAAKCTKIQMPQTF